VTNPAGRTLEYHVLDVFTDRAFAGNPLAVVLDADDLSTSQLQSLAREFHLSETAFPMAASASEVADGADYRLRIFTPEVELPFAGHPSVGSACLLTQLGRVSGETVRQACGAGVLPLDVTADGKRATLTGGKPVVGGAIDPSEALHAVGLSATNLLGPASVVAGTGLPYVVVPVTTDALDRVSPDLSELKRLFRHPHEATGVYLVAWEPAEAAPTRVQARMFAGDVGVAEDPATGSAALALGAALPSMLSLADGETALAITQGVAMGRPSSLRVQVDVVAGRATRVRVSGGVAHVASGRVLVPTD
jgi:trans-2,3-dihydro-3-hydroxyanthranilate isomerase